MAQALRRLAILESQPLCDVNQLMEWRTLRSWVIDNDLVDAYRNQPFFKKLTEETQPGIK
jgi:hypothetical protein|tara:strand:+ start:169 stop:348 length:180 start_codon:yes stop_codon:yes gene_type:complete